MEAEVFISYARENQGFVRRIAQALAASGNHTWVDWEGIEPSDRWLQSVHEAIDAADAVVAVLSTAFLSSEPCRGEIAHAAQQHKRLIPVVIEDLPEEAPIPDSLRELNWISLRPEDGFENGMERFVRAIRLDLDLVRTHTRVLTRAQAWDLSGRRTTSLLRGVDLEQAEQWLARAVAGSEPQPTELQANFVRAGRQNATRRHRIILAIATTVAAVSAALAAFALVQRSTAIHQAHVATSRELALEAESHLSGDPQLALILALRSYHESASPEAATAVRNAVQSSIVRAYLDRPGIEAPPEFDRTGDYVLSLNPADTDSRHAQVRVWAWRRPAGTKPLWVLHDRRASCARFARDQDYINIVNDDGTVLRWKWRTSSRPAVIGKLPLHSPLCQLSPDNRTVAEGTHSGLAVGSLTNPAARQVVLPGTASKDVLFDVVDDAAFSPNGRLLVVFGGPAVSVYDVADGQIVAHFDLTKNGPVATSNGAAIDPTGSRLAVAEESVGNSPSVAVYSLHRPTSPPVIRRLVLGPPAVPNPSAHPAMTPASVAWSPDGAALAVGWLGDTRIWWGSAPTPIYLNASDELADGDVAFNADGRYLVTSGAVIQVWDWQAGSPAVLTLSPTADDPPALLSPNGLVVAIGSNLDCSNGNALLWNWQSGSSSTLTTGCPVAFSSDGRYLAVVSINGQSTKSVLSVWSTRTHEELASLSVDGTISLSQAEFVPKSNSLAFLELNDQFTNQLADWNWQRPAASGSSTTVLRLSSRYASSLVGGPTKDGSIYFLLGRSLYRWTGRSNHRPILVSRTALTVPAQFGSPNYRKATLLPDHRHLVVGLSLALAGGGGATVISDIRTGDTHQVLTVRSVVPFALSRNGRLIAISGQSGQVLVWDVDGTDAAVQVATFDIATLSFDASASRLALDNQNGVEVIPCSDCGSLAHVLAVAKSHVVRRLTTSEQHTYLHSG